MVASPIQRRLCQQPPKMTNLKKKVERSLLKVALETVQMHLVRGKGKSTGSDSYQLVIIAYPVEQRYKRTLVVGDTSSLVQRPPPTCRSPELPEAPAGAVK